MNKRETVQALADSIQRGDFEVVKSMLADGFQFSGFIPDRSAVYILERQQSRN